MSEQWATPNPQVRVLFVCTANISRSPFATRRAAQLASAALHVDGAGVPGLEGRGLDPEIGKVLKQRGADWLGHVSKRLNDDLMEWADLVLTMEFAHQMLIYDRWPQHDRKVFGLIQFADALGRLEGVEIEHVVVAAQSVARPNSMTWDVADPYRRGPKAAERTADEIDNALAVIIPALTRSTER